MRVWLKNNRVMLDPNKSNLVSACETCPCACPDAADRGIRYVDKHATGTGDGLSWANAYTDLQAAIAVFSRHKIYIKGYGSSDPYDSVSLAACTWLEGGVDGDVYISGSTYAIHGNNHTGTHLKNLFVINATAGVYFFNGATDGVTADGCYHGFSQGDGSSHINATAINCTAIGFVGIQNSTLLNITANYNDTGVALCHNSTLTNGTVNNNLGPGVASNENCTITSFSANNNGGCGFFQNTGSVYITCSESGNGGTSCDAV